MCKGGGTSYLNYDTDGTLAYTYVADEAENVPEIVMANAGRMGQGDFKWQFNNAVEDENYLFKLTRHIMADYQMEVVRLEIKKIEKEIQEASSDNLASLQTRYQQLLAARAQLSKELGERIINL